MPKADEYEAELFDHTRVLDDAALAALTHEDADMTLHFEGKPGALDGVTRGSVLLGGTAPSTPQGLLRLVTKVESESTGTAVHTMHAPLQLAFKKLHVRGEREIRRGTGSVDAREKAGGGAFPSAKVDFYAFNGDGDPATKDDQVRVQGTFEAGFSYTFGIDVDWGDLEAKAGEAVDCVLSLFSDCDPEALLPEVKAGLEAKAGAEASLDVEGVAFLGYERELELANVPLDPITIGPLVFLPSVEVLAKIEGRASSRFSLTSSAKAGAEAGFSYSSKHGGKLVPPSVQEPVFEAPNVDATLSAFGRMRVGPRLHLRLYGVFGPYASFYAFASLDADVARNPCFELKGGLEGDVGIDLVIDTPVYQLSLGNWEEPFGIAEETIADGTCDIPPGGVPEIDEAFANPSFTPWSRVYGDTLDGFQFVGPGGQVAHTRVQQTVDGHYLVTGTATHSLLKLDEQGDVVWAKQYVLPESFDPGLSSYELSIESAAPTLDAGLLLTGYPYTLLATDQAGKLRWAQTFDAPYYDSFMRFVSVVPSTDGSFFVVGNYADDRYEMNTVDHWVSKVDASGTVLWSRRIGESNLGDMARAAVALDDGVVVVGSQWNPTGSLWRATLMRIDAEGDLVWSRMLTFDDAGSEVRGHLVAVRVARDGDLLVGGTLDGTGPGSAMLVLKVKPADGSVAWSNIESTPDGYLGMELTDLVELPTSGMLAVGNYERIGTDMWLAGLDGVGKSQWLRRYGQTIDAESAEAEESNNPGVLVTDDGGALIVGSALQLAAGDEEGLWALKVPAKDGTISFDPVVATTSELTRETESVTLANDAWAPPSAKLDVDVTPVELDVRTVSTNPRTLSP